jgi:hypothetical protein
MQPKRTSKKPIPSSSCQRGSSSSVHLVLLLVFMFLLVYPLAATPLFPHVSLFRRKARVVCTIGTSPLSMRWWVVDACTLFTTPIIVSARTCQQWQVPPWPWILRTRRVESRKSNLRVVWRGSQRVNYVCMLCCMYNVHCKIVVELWVEVGLNKKHNSIIIYLLYLIYYDKTLRSAIDWLKYYNPNKNENKHQILNTDLKFLGLVNSICRTVSWFLETWTIFC